MPIYEVCCVSDKHGRSQKRYQLLSKSDLNRALLESVISERERANYDPDSIINQENAKTLDNLIEEAENEAKDVVPEKLLDELNKKRQPVRVLSSLEKEMKTEVKAQNMNDKQGTENSVGQTQTKDNTVNNGEKQTNRVPGDAGDKFRKEGEVFTKIMPKPLNGYNPSGNDDLQKHSKEVDKTQGSKVDQQNDDIKKRLKNFEKLLKQELRTLTKLGDNVEKHASTYKQKKIQECDSENDPNCKDKLNTKQRMGQEAIHKTIEIDPENRGEKLKGALNNGNRPGMQKSDFRNIKAKEKVENVNRLSNIVDKLIAKYIRKEIEPALKSYTKGKTKTSDDVTKKRKKFRLESHKMTTEAMAVFGSNGNNMHKDNAKGALAPRIIIRPKCAIVCEDKDITVGKGETPQPPSVATKPMEQTTTTVHDKYFYPKHLPQSSTEHQLAMFSTNCKYGYNYVGNTCN